MSFPEPNPFLRTLREELPLLIVLGLILVAIYILWQVIWWWLIKRREERQYE
jgi:hypothetical protein